MLAWLSKTSGPLKYQSFSQDLTSLSLSRFIEQSIHESLPTQECCPRYFRKRVKDMFVCCRWHLNRRGGVSSRVRGIREALGRELPYSTSHLAHSLYTGVVLLLVFVRKVEGLVVLYCGNSWLFGLGKIQGACLIAILTSPEYD